MHLLHAYRTQMTYMHMLHVHAHDAHKGGGCPSGQRLRSLRPQYSLAIPPGSRPWRPVPAVCAGTKLPVTLVIPGRRLHHWVLRPSL